MVRGEKAPWPDATAVVRSVSEDKGTRKIGRALSDLHHDATRDCERCGLPMTPVAIERGQVVLECANRHRATASLPKDPAARERVRNWIARRGAQLHAQHERWDAEREDE